MSSIFHRHTHIGLDLDETLAESIMDGLHKLHKLGKMQVIQEWQQITSFDWTDFPGCDMKHDELMEFWKKHHLKDAKPLQFSIDGVYQLSEMGKILHVVTARNEHDHKHDTIKWVGKYFPEIHPDNIHFANHLSKENRTKSSICKSYGINLMIDDGLHNAIDLAENDIECILLDKPWNQISTLHPNIYRMKDWNEILSHLE